MSTDVMIYCFWVCAACIVLAAGVGILSIWIEDLWANHRWAWKLEQTAGIFGFTSLALAVVVWLFKWLVR